MNFKKLRFDQQLYQFLDDFLGFWSQANKSINEVLSAGFEKDDQSR